jgi:hypothetical protein
MGQTTTQSYKRCSTCKEEILMSKASGKWKALDETQGVLQREYAVVIIASATTTRTAA